MEEINMTEKELDEWLAKKEAEHKEYDRKKKKDAERMIRLLNVLSKEAAIENERRREAEKGRFMVHVKGIRF